MKKITITSLAAMFVVAGSASASPLFHRGMFDISYRPGAENFFAASGVTFVTGETENAGSMTDIASGETHQVPLKGMYGFTDMFAVTLDMGNEYASPELGINWRVLNDASFSIEVLASYGIAWTEEAVAPNTRIGDNNLKAGARIFGLAGNFQWGANVWAQYVFVDTDDFLNLNMLFQGQYNFSQTYALYAELGYDIQQISEDTNFYDRYLNVGYVYNISKTAALMPFVGYHFATANSDNSNTMPDNYWQLGAKFAVEF